MNNEKLNRWADKLLDLGKTNNLIKFRDTKSSAAELICPDTEMLFKKADNNAVLEVFDPFKDDDFDIELFDRDDIPDRQSYLEMYQSKLKRANQILVYNKYQYIDPILKNISRKAKSALEETGVNVVWLAFGFVGWRERADSEIMNAPLLLVPVRIERETQLSPWMIRTFGDEIAVNSTFDYSMQQQFGVGLPPYQDESLLDYLTKVADLVSPLGWSVSNECKIGIFSFLKINMYHDLKDNQELILSNPNVRMLLNEPTDCIDTGELNDNVTNPLIDLHNVVDADSSQIEAIRMVKSGKSFVLQGPPGTGKSQTITNMIAECLSDGKRVLFVAEKQAALNVVHDKLRKAGLDEFCLELHSHKANKKTVIEELCRTLRLNKTAVSKLAEDRIADKQQKQQRLDEYEHELHKQREPIGLSLYQIIQAYYRCGNDIDEGSTRIDDIQTKGTDYLRQASELAEQYAAFTETVGEDYRSNVWYGCVSADNSFAHTDTVGEYMDKLISTIGELDPIRAELSRTFGLKADSLSDVSIVSQLFRMLSDGDVVTPALLEGNIITLVTQKFQKMTELANKIKSKQALIDEIFEPTVYEIDGRKTAANLLKYPSFMSRLFSKDYKQLIAQICGCMKSGKKPPYEKAVTYMNLLSTCQSWTASFDEEHKWLSKYIGTALCGLKTDTDAVGKTLDIVEKINRNGYDFGNISAACRSSQSNLSRIGQLSALIDGILNGLGDVPAKLGQIFDPAVIIPETDSLDRLLEWASKCVKNIDTLSNWISFYRLLSDMRSLGMEDWLIYIAESHCPKENIPAMYRKLFYRRWAEYIINDDKVFKNWTRAAADMTVSAFTEADNEHFRINKAIIRGKVSAKRPNTDIVASGSPMQLLFAEEKKKRRQKPIRELLAKTADLVQIIKPCFMMSPLSVSTFLSDNTIHFDTVIFDEASQIFPQDAIGAIYRAKQAVIVGDCRQMPPTNFFNVSFDSDDEDEDDGTADFESVLDLCSVRMPQKRLRWHYRSRYESLITFSNKNFYDNDLVTFPAALADKGQDGAGVDYYFADGIFDRRSRTNRIEAEAIVNIIYDNIARFPNRSMGVVAFSVSQADLIDRLLSKRRQNVPECEDYFRSDKAEPFFVKNLETVQGDERDIIIFSTAYGRDKDGKLLLNFGPINRLGGERRLNVAVTRAKYNVQVVSSMHAADIDLNRTNSKGAALLHEYLSYAEQGYTGVKMTDNGDDYDIGIEEDVCSFLRDNGYDADIRVGCSEFRIDVGVKMPGSDDYIMAVECDGLCYHNAANARDRDRLRRQILEDMGWQYYRIWSVVWYRNNRIEKQRLLDAVHNAADEYERKAIEREQMLKAEPIREQNNLTADEYTVIESDSSHSMISITEETPSPSDVSEPLTKHLSDDGFLLPKSDITDDHQPVDQDDVYDSYEMPVENKTLSIQPYRLGKTGGYRLKDMLDTRLFHKMVKSVLEFEAPLSIRWLTKRLSYLYDTTNITKSIDNFVRRSLAGSEAIGIVRRNGFLYLVGKPIVLRGPMSDGTVRDIQYISADEIAAGIMAVLKQNIQADKKGLFKTIANQLGFPRVSNTITSKCEQALVLLVDKVECDGETVRVK